MTRTMNPDMEAALLRKGIIPVSLVKLDTDGGEVRVWSGIGDITFNSEIYSGVGTLGGITANQEAMDLSATGIQLSLSGIPSSLIATALTDVRQGRKVSVWYGLVKDPVADNIVTNGFFDSDLTGWQLVTAGSGAVTWKAGGYVEIKVIAFPSNTAGMRQQLLGLDTSKTYQLIFEQLPGGSGSGSGASISETSWFPADILNETLDPSFVGVKKFIFQPTVVNPYLIFAEFAIATINIDNIIILENEPVTLIDDPVLIFEGQTDSVVINEGVDTSQIVISVENRLLRLEKNNSRRFTKQDQIRISATDLGFDYVESIQTKEILWGRQ